MGLSDKRISARIILFGVLFSIGSCSWIQQDREIDDVYSTEYLKAREGKHLIYPEGVDPPKRESTYDIPPLSSEADTQQNYDINELMVPPDLIGDGSNRRDRKNTADFIRQEKPRIYTGVGLGYIDFKDRYQRIPYSETPIALHLYGGYRLNDYLAFELAYKQTDDINIRTPGSGFEQLDISSKFNALVARAQVSLPTFKLFNLPGEFTIFGTAGYFNSKVHRNVLELNSLETDSTSGSDSGQVLGGGLLYQHGKLKLRGYFESFETSEVVRADDFGITFEFGF
ncbi:MAG: outer membrane beta-barrel protein [Gammaproteobacteria bacterium]|nr:outer membrane beta-barrel protein [Gammaproteobacteria bacterium]